MLNAIKNIFDTRPSGLETARQQQSRTAPVDWHWSGWLDQNANPVPRPEQRQGEWIGSEFHIPKCYILGMHRSQKKYAGIHVQANLHVIISDTPSAGLPVTFMETREGGLEGRFYDPTPRYYRQLHAGLPIIREHDRDNIAIEDILRDGLKTGLPVSLTGFALFLRFEDPDLQRDCQFKGWYRGRQCPVGSIETAELLAR